MKSGLKILIPLVILVASFIAPAAMKGATGNELTLHSTVPTPSTTFYGSVSVIANSSSPWRCDLGNNTYVEVIPWKNKTTEEYWEPWVEYKLYTIETDSSAPKLLCSQKIIGNNNKTAIKIEQNSKELNFYSAGGRALFKDVADLRRLAKNSEIKVYAKNANQIEQIINKLEPYPIRANYLDYYNRFSQDSIDYNQTHYGKWVYLDRVTPKNQHVKLGNKYTLELVPDENNRGALLLLYFDETGQDGNLWEKGDLKGVLTPTSFENHYNLEWYDVNKNSVGQGECSATFEGVNLLILDFPLLESQLRFQRVIN